VKSHFACRKSDTKFLCVKTVSVHWPIYPAKMIGGARLLLRENLADADPPQCALGRI